MASLDEARAARTAAGRPQRRWAIGMGIAAAVAAAFTVGAVLIHPGANPGQGVAGAPAGTTAVASGAPAVAGSAVPSVTTGATRQAVVAEPHHLDELLPKITGSAPAGPLSDPARLAACLAANGASGEKVLGVLPVRYTGQQAYAISLRGPDGAQRILVVRPDCGAGGRGLLEEQTTR